MGTDALPPTDRMIPESLVREFIGYLSGAVPELHRVEVPLLAKHWDDFKWTVGDRLSGEPAPATTDRVAPSFDAWWNDDAYGCLRYSDPVQFDRLRQAFNAGVAAARAAPEPRDEPLPPCSTCGGETVPFCTSCGYTTTKPAEYPAYTECQHDHMKPNPTLRATYPKHGSQSGWVQEYRCNVCQCSFERPIATAGLRANGETP